MNVKGNCLRIKNNHKNRIGRKADFSFLITMNFIKAPATKIPRRLLIYQTSGRTKTSTAARETDKIIEIITIRGALLRQIEVRSMK